MPAPSSPPSAVREPLVSLSSLMVSLPEMVLPSSDLSSFFSRPALLLPLFSSLAPSSSMAASWSPCTVTAALPASTGLSPLTSPSVSSLTFPSVLPLTFPSVLPLPSTSVLPLPSPSFLPLTSIFRSSKVTSTLPSEVSMVTVFLSDSPVMTVSPSSFSKSFSPCLTLL